MCKDLYGPVTCTIEVDYAWFCYSEGIISGSGNDSFPVVNGRGQLSFKLESGDYRVTIQDLHAGVNDYYTESEAFSVPNCGIRISTFSEIALLCMVVSQSIVLYRDQYLH